MTILFGFVLPGAAQATPQGPAAPPSGLSGVAVAMPSTALFYAARVPRELFAQFDRVVVDPDHMPEPPRNTRATAFAYVSLGEVHPSRSWHNEMPQGLVRGRNDAFGSEILDVTSDAWRSFVVERLVKPLYGRGWRGFFFDTLDSYQQLKPSPDQAAAYERGLAAIVLEIHKRFPDAKLILNRGFEILPAVGKSVDGIVVESVFQTYDFATKTFASVPQAATAALLKQLEGIKGQYGIPITIIDYVDPANQALRVATAKRILQAGFDPWVTGPDLDEIGVGRVRIVPRKVLILHRQVQDHELSEDDVCLLVGPYLEWHGYIPEYADVRKGLPAHSLVGQYAGVVVYLPGGGADEVALRRWVTKHLDKGMRMAFLHGFGFQPDPAFLTRLGLGAASSTVTPPMQLVGDKSPYVGFEAPARARVLDRPLARVAATDGSVRSFLHIEDAAKNTWDGIVMGPWGGVAFDPYVLEDGLNEGRRWILDPFKFYQDALQLPPLPAPDVTTESGRRIWTNHIDGDAFYSRAEKPKAPFAGEVELQEILKKYQVPHTVSIVEGEISHDGLVMHPPAGKPYPDPLVKTPEDREAKIRTLENTAREIFKLPWVEIASHTFSHPFSWRDAELGRSKTEEGTAPNLEIEGYKFSLERDIKGSIDYINKNLAPPGKQVKVLLWSGNCSPSNEAVAFTQKLGVYNVNGAGFTRTTDRPSLTRGSAMGVPKGDDAYQVFAVVNNENVYTNVWHGPFYGYRYAVETFQLNDSPRRLTSLPIYYHFYSASKLASLVALKEVYDWASKQETTPLFLSEYAARVLSFQRLSLAVRVEDGAWQVRDAGDLRTLRVHGSLGWPDLSKSVGIAGVHDLPQGRYVSLSGGSADLFMQQAPPAVVHLESANGKVLAWERDGSKVKLHIQGYVPLSIAVGGARACELRGSFGTSKAVRSGSAVRFSLKSTDTGDAVLDCN